MTAAPDEEFCANCGELVKQQASLCPHCGTSREASVDRRTQQTVYCTACGEELVAEAELCPNCGVRQTPTADASSSDTSELLYYGQIALGGLLLLSALGSLTDPTMGLLSSLLSAIVLGGLGALTLPQVRDRLNKNHPVGTFGWVQVVDTTPATGTTEVCASCHGDVTQGVKREYGKAFVIAGVTVYATREGENYYCKTCDSAERAVEQFDVDDTDISNL